MTGVGNQTNTDADLAAAGASVSGDSLGDACDDDDDNDSLGLTQNPGPAATQCPEGTIAFWADCIESYLGTNPLDNCTGPPGSGGDAWPPDVDRDRLVSGVDVLNVFAFWLTPTARYDLDASGSVSGVDVLILYVFWLRTCS